MLFVGSIFLAALLLALGATGTGAERKKCDMKEVKIGYQCPLCEKIYDKPGKCKECDVKDEAIIPQKIEYCVKTGYICEDCDTASLKPGKCESCGKELVAKTVKSEVVYRCPQCKRDYDAPGTCEICITGESAPLKLEKTCRHSGIFPHVSE